MADKYWVGSGSTTSWDAITPTNWSLTDGGANDAAVPVAGDDVFFKSAVDCSLNAGTADLNSFDMTGYTGIFTGGGGVAINVKPSSGTVICKLEGTVTSLARVNLVPQAGTTINFTTGGKSIDSVFGLWQASTTGTVEQQDAITVGASCIMYITHGNWNTNGFNITSNGFYSNYSNVRSLNCTNSTITTSTVNTNLWNMSTSTNMSLTATGSTIIGTGANGTFAGGGLTYNIVTLSGNNQLISGSNTFTTLNVNQAGNATGLNITAGSTQTVANFSTNGFASNLAKMQSTSAGNAFTLTTGSSQISVDYMSIQDSTATEADTWYAGANSTDVSGNSGWIFTAPPPPPTFSKIMGIAI